MIRTCLSISGFLCVDRCETCRGKGGRDARVGPAYEACWTALIDAEAASQRGRTQCSDACTLKLFLLVPASPGVDSFQGSSCVDGRVSGTAVPGAIAAAVEQSLPSHNINQKGAPEPVPVSFFLAGWLQHSSESRILRTWSCFCVTNFCRNAKPSHSRLSFGLSSVLISCNSLYLWIVCRKDPAIASNAKRSCNSRGTAHEGRHRWHCGLRVGIRAVASGLRRPSYVTATLLFRCITLCRSDCLPSYEV